MTVKKREYEVRVNHPEGLFGFYKITASNSNDAERKAIQKFDDEICGGKRVRKLTAYTINNPDWYDSIAPYMDEIMENI